jgi:hypothetical protein
LSAFLIFSSSLYPDSTIAIWDFADLTAESCLEDVNVTHNPDVRRDSEKVFRHLLAMFLDPHLFRLFKPEGTLSWYFYLQFF